MLLTAQKAYHDDNNGDNEYDYKIINGLGLAVSVVCLVCSTGESGPGGDIVGL